MIDMIEKWSNFVKCLKTYTAAPADSKYVALESYLKLQLGWLEHDNCLKKIKSGSTLLGLSMSFVEYHGPVITVSFFDTKDDAELNAYVREVMDQTDVDLCINFSGELKLFYKPMLECKPFCIKRIVFKEDNEDGIALVRLLNRSSFNRDSINKYCKDLYSSIGATEQILHLLSDEETIKSILLEYFQFDGYAESTVKGALDKVEISLGIRGKINQIPPKKTLNKRTTSKGVSRDNTKFSIDGKNYYNKRIFVLNVIRTFVAEHPESTYDDLEIAFPSSIISKERGIVRPIEFVENLIKTNPEVKNRYCMKDGEPITLCNGQVVVVHNQWGTQHFPKFLKWIEKMYHVTSDKEYEYYSIPDKVENEQNSVSEPTEGLVISEESIKRFSNKK